MKKIFILWTMTLFAIALVSCTEAEEEPIIEPVETDYSNCKAKGYDYDFRSISDYELVWSDEFNVDGMPDSTNWGYDVGGSGWGNNELQYYTNSGNAWIEDGELIIEARKETYLNREYTSARLVTRGKQVFRYGKFEIKAMLPIGRGTWPAIWMLPTTSYYGGWPDSGEIDIMEHVGYDQNVIHGSIHTEDYNHKIGTQKGGSKVIDTASTEYHVYAIEWLPDRIIFSIDDITYYTFVPGLYLKCPTSEQWPFDIGYHLLLNIAIGGDWGGAQGIDDSVYPQRMIIDYVRVYQSDFIQNLQKG